MTTITKLDKKSCKAIQQPIEDAVNAALEPFGLKAVIGGGSYNETELKTKLTISVTDTDVLEAQERADFALYSRSYNVTPEDYGTVFQYQGKDYAIIGFNPRSPKYGVKVRRLHDGQVMKFTESALRHCPSRKAA